MIMNKLISLSLLATLIVSFSASANKSLILDATANLTDSRLINKRVFGIHGELLWSPIRLGQPLLSNIYNEVGFQDIRLPGGAAGNHYLSQSSMFGCNKTGAGEKTLTRIKKYNHALSLKNRSYTTDDFLAFIKQANTEFTLIINVLCDTPENTEKWMAQIRDSGVTVKYVEMGSEYYFEEYLWAFPTPSEYIKQAEMHAVAVRKIFPDVKVSLDTSSASYRSKHFPDFAKMSKNKRHKRGLEYDKLVASASFADAYIIHIYSPLGTNRRDKALDSISNTKAYSNAISHFDGRIIPSMQYLHELSLNKKVWVTEWGTAFYGWQRKHESDFLNTHYNALYVTNAFLTYFSIPYIESTNYHNFPNLWSDFKRLEPNPLYYAMKLFKEPMLKTDKITSITLSGEHEYISTHPDFKGKNDDLNSVLFHNEKEGYLFIVNKFGRHYSISSLVDAGKSGEIEMIDFEQIMPNKSGAPNFEKIIEKKQVIGKGMSVDIAPYSITRVTVKIKTDVQMPVQKNKIVEDH